MTLAIIAIACLCLACFSAGWLIGICSRLADEPGTPGKWEPTIINVEAP